MMISFTLSPLLEKDDFAHVADYDITSPRLSSQQSPIGTIIDVAASGNDQPLSIKD